MTMLSKRQSKKKMTLKEFIEIVHALLWIASIFFIIAPLSVVFSMLRARLANKRRNSPIHHKINLAVLAFLLLAMALIPLAKL
jgi:hypothetical protein